MDLASKKSIKKIIYSCMIGIGIFVGGITAFASPLQPNMYNTYSNSIKQLDNSNIIYMESTGYSQYDAGCGAYTATGDYVKYGIAAVDPDVISLGTNLYVDGYGYAVAADTGGAIVGQRIDLAFDSHQDALNWGRQYVNVYIQ